MSYIILLLWATLIHFPELHSHLFKLFFQLLFRWRIEKRLKSSIFCDVAYTEWSQGRNLRKLRTGESRNKFPRWDLYRDTENDNFKTFFKLDSKFINKLKTKSYKENNSFKITGSETKVIFKANVARRWHSHRLCQPKRTLKLLCRLRMLPLSKVRTN